MLESAEAISSFVEGKTRQDLNTNRLLLSGIVRELEILGEAAGKISQETKDRFTSIPWRQLIGMRNRLIHAYFDIDCDIVWVTTQNSISTLCQQLKEIINQFP